MKKSSLLNSIDAYFATKKESEVKMYLFLAAIVFGALAYFLLADPATDFFESEKSGLERVTSNLNTTNAYLASVSDPSGKDVNFRIKQKQNILNNEKKKLEDLKAGNKYVEGKLQEVSSVTYNERNWAKFLDDLTTLAQRYNVKLYSLVSEAKDLESGVVQEVLNVVLNTEGVFNNVLKYINAIEESEMVVDIHGLDLNSTGEKIAGDINISLWGVKYGDGANLNIDEVNKNLAKSVGDKNSKAGKK